MQLEVDRHFAKIWYDIARKKRRKQTMAFGDQLQEVRRRSGLTQEQFAEELQVSRQAVSRWESGRSYPEVDKILYICNRYGVPIGQLFAEEAPAPENGAPQQPQETAQPPKNSLFASLDSFITNLSPKSKWIGIGILVGVALLALLIGLCLKGGSGDMSTIIWIAAIVIFGVVEAATVGLVSIWFVIGSVAGLITAVLGGPIWLQVVMFFIVSIAALIATRPLVRKLGKKGEVATNADRVLGGTARVTETIDNTIPSGEVYIDGKTWTARSQSGAVIAPETLVTVIRLEGVKLYVDVPHDCKQ